MADDVNLNVAKCLREVTDFGVSHVHNICSGAVADVPWGSVDWLGFVAACAFGGAFILMLSALGIAMIRDI